MVSRFLLLVFYGYIRNAFTYETKVKINKMKKGLVLLLSVVMSVITLHSQESKTLTLRAGTPVQIMSENGLRASKVLAGDEVEFRVATAVNVNDVTVIPYNSLVKGTVTEAKKNAIFGIKGKLSIQINSIVLPSGEIIPLSNKILNFDGNSNTAWVLPVGLLLVWPILLVPGQRGEMKPGYSTMVTVAVDTNIKVNNISE